MESQVTRKDGIIKELEDQLRVVKADYNDKWTEWKHKVVTLTLFTCISSRTVIIDI